MSISQNNEIELWMHITHCTCERLSISSSNRSTPLILSRSSSLGLMVGWVRPPCLVCLGLWVYY